VAAPSSLGKRSVDEVNDECTPESSRPRLAPTASAKQLIATPSTRVTVGSDAEQRASSLAATAREFLAKPSNASAQCRLTLLQRHATVVLLAVVDDDYVFVEFDWTACSDVLYITDESSLQLGLHGNRVYVRRPKGDAYRMLDQYVWHDETKVKTGTIKFFGGFSASAIGELYFYEKMNGQLMARIVDERFVPEMRQLGCKEFLHDHDKKFRCNVVHAKLHLRCLQQINDAIWPSYSPDLNPIENLWGDVGSRVWDRNPKGVDELKEFLLEEWQNTLTITCDDDTPLIRKLARSLVQRAALVIIAKGWRIPY
jgi:DDE superfamily endonuclease